MTAVTAPPPARRRGLLRRREKPQGRPGIDRPRLLSDVRWGKRIGILVALAVGGVILSHIVRYQWAAVYYLITQTTETVNSAWHAFLSVDWQRHLARYGIEGLFTGASVLVIFYGIKKWPPKPAGWWTTHVKRYLLIPSDRLPDQSLWCLAVAPLWIVIYALPWGIAITLILTWTKTGDQPLTLDTSHISPLLRSDLELANWQQPLIGFITAFLGARRVVKGTAFHSQRLIIKQSLEGKVAHGRELLPPAWMRLFPYLRWRYQWSAARVTSGAMVLGTNRVWAHQAAQRRFHAAMFALGVLGLAYLTYMGWHILTYLDWSFTHPFRLG